MKCVRANLVNQKVYVIPASESYSTIQQFRAADDCTDLPEPTLITSFKSETFSLIYGKNSDGTIDLGNLDLDGWQGGSGGSSGGSSSGGCNSDDDDDSQALGRCDAADSDNGDSVNGDLCFFPSESANGEGATEVRYFKGGIYFRLSARFDFYLYQIDFDKPKPPKCKDVPHTLTYSGSWNRCGPGGVGNSSGTRAHNDCKTVVGLYSGTRRLKTYGLSASSTWSCKGQSISTGTATISG